MRDDLDITRENKTISNYDDDYLSPSKEALNKFRKSDIYKEIKENTDLQCFNFSLFIKLPALIKQKPNEKDLKRKKSKKNHENAFLDYLKNEEIMESFTVYPAMSYVFFRNCAIIYENGLAFQFFQHGLNRWYKTLDMAPIWLLEIHRRIYANVPKGKITINKDLQMRLNADLVSTMKAMNFII